MCIFFQRDIDTRLRPSGISGLLACAADAFEEYQLTEAWTWEHQALVRARLIYADEPLGKTFKTTREKVLTQTRDPNKLKHDVVIMREKMRDHLSAKKPGRFMLKQDKGGITDIEFLVQYLVLQHSHDKAPLTVWSDNVRILENCAQQGLITDEVARNLIEAYTCLRDEIHHRNLLNLDADVDDSCFVEQRQCIKQQWQQWFNG